MLEDISYNVHAARRCTVGVARNERLVVHLAIRGLSLLLSSRCCGALVHAMRVDAPSLGFTCATRCSGRLGRCLQCCINHLANGRTGCALPQRLYLALFHALRTYYPCAHAGNGIWDYSLWGWVPCVPMGTWYSLKTLCIEGSV
jgi:hypothetical protein